MKKWYKNNFFYLSIILLLAAILRFYALGRADVLTDEASLIFRSIGYFDWLATPYQTTPLEWLPNRPWWLYLSFHDHPFFTFFLQFLQLKITGVSIWTMRLWPALYGVISVWLIYKIGKKLFNTNLGLLAAIILATNNLHVWISRLALQEALVILLILLSILLFLKTLENKKNFYWLGLVIGLALASKLTTIIIWPALLIYLLIFKRQYFKYKELYLSLLITLVLFSPYVVYNIFLSKNFGHFDFQLSYLLKQPVEAWQIRPGRAEIPSRLQAFNFIFLGLQKALSPASLYLYLLSLASGLFYFIKNKFKNIQPSYYLLAIIIVLHIILYVFIGSSTRFLSMIIPWLAIVLALVFQWLLKIKYLGYIILTIFIGYQISFCWQTNISYSHNGQAGLNYSELKSQVYGYGYNELTDYVDKFLANKKPAVTLPIVNPNINNLVKTQASKQSGDSQPLMIVFDSRMYGEAVVWSLTRHFLYAGWPILTFDTYLQALEQNGSELFSQMGINDIYYLATTDNMILENTISQEMLDKLKSFEQELQDSGKLIDTIYNQKNQAIFKIYRF